MKLTPLKFPALIVCAISLSSCTSSLKIWASKVQPAEVKNYKTYAWIAPGDTALNTRRDDKLYAGVIEKAANKELQKKGLKLDNQNPDVVFMFDTKIDEKVVTRKTAETNDGAFGFGGYNYGYYGSGYYAGNVNPMRGLETAPMLVDEGTLGYSMFDRNSGKLIWQSTAKKDLSKKTNIGSTIKRATKFMFAKLPMKQK